MAKRKAGTKKAKQATDGQNGGVVALTKELFQAAITLRGSVEPADYKRYVLPIIFLRFLSLRYDRRRAELEALVADKKSDYFGDKKAIQDPDEYRRVGAFVIPEAARWENLRKAAQADDIKVKLDDVLESLENKYPDKLKGLLPRIYAGSNLDAVSVRGLINLFSKDIFEADHGGDDLIGRVYEYFIGEFASSEGKRGGEYFTPVSIVKTLIAMLEPEKGVVFDPCCGSGGMFVQSDLFTKHSHQLSFVGQESKDFTYRLCRMNLFIHGLDANIQLGNSYFDDKHATLKADYVLANPPFSDGSKGENGWGADRVADKDPRLVIGGTPMPLATRNANTMWILHFLSHLKDGGTTGFVMATGELSSTEPARLEVRRTLVEHDYVDCIVRLPSQLFANTPIPSSLWFLSKGRRGSGGFRKRVGEVLFIDCQRLGSLILGSRKQKQLLAAEIERIANTYRQFRRAEAPSEVLGFCKVVTTALIRENGYVLSPGRYVGSHEGDDDEEIPDAKIRRLLTHFKAEVADSHKLDAAIVRTAERMQPAPPRSTPKQADAPLRLGDLVSLVRGTTYQSRLLDQPGPVLLGLASILPNGGFRRGSLRTYAGDSPEKLLMRPGDLYVSLKDVTQSGDLLGSVARVPIDILLGRLTQDTAKLVLRQGSPPAAYIYWLLRTPDYRDYCRERAIGTTNLSLSREDFFAFPVAPPNPERLALIALLEGVENKIELTQRSNRTLGDLRDTLLGPLLSGEFAIADAEKAVAEAV